MLRAFSDNRSMGHDTIGDEVRDQYESLPYPARDPADENLARVVDDARARGSPPSES